MTTIVIQDGKGARAKMEERAARFEGMLRLSGVEYSVISSRTTKQVIPSGGVEGRRYIIKGLTGKELNFIKAVKAYVRTLEVPDRIRPFATSIPFNLNATNLSQGEYFGYCEIDVSSAYWKTAFNLQYINRPLFDLGNNKDVIRKKVRLMALGSLAKRTEKITYCAPYRPQDMTVKVDTCELEVFWDNISYSFGLVMQEAFNAFSNQMLGYWVDAIFIRQDVATLARKFFSSQGFDVKLVPLEKIEVLSAQKDGYLFVRRHFPGGEIKDLPAFDQRTGAMKGSSYKAARERFLRRVAQYM